jgi:NAD(P)-dependent dehydrogenase (short-subunit alcohol dehydrogenase family)
MGKLEGNTALMTSGTSGIGLETARQCVHEGAYVCITGRRGPELAAAVKEIGSNITGVQGDVSNLSDLDRLFVHIKREQGTLDMVFANAGVAQFAPFGEITEEHYDTIFTINVKGLLFTVQKALPLLPDGASIRLCSKVAFWKQNPKMGSHKINDLGASTFLFSVICDRAAMSPGDTPRHVNGNHGPEIYKAARILIRD